MFQTFPNVTPGSSPRMRGTRHYPGRRFVDRGIIPAHAGNTGGVHSCFIPLGDHPRACGEHPAFFNPVPDDKGSSPRMRGTLSPEQFSVFSPGIIPAHAGNTLECKPCSRSLRDHPRACGEHFSLDSSPCMIAGSSPRMRGTLWPKSPAPPERGIIPAHAGNTAKQCRASVAHWDHPRACGEHVAETLQHCLISGSSPRMRGTH